MAFVEQEDVFAVVEELFSVCSASSPIGKCPRRRSRVFPTPTPCCDSARTNRPALRARNPKISPRFSQTLRLGCSGISFAAGGVVRALCVPAMEGSRARFSMASKHSSKKRAARGCVPHQRSASHRPNRRSPRTERTQSHYRRMRRRAGAPPFSSSPAAASRGRSPSGDGCACIWQTAQFAAGACYEFCWIVDFPMYEWDEERACVAFSHNPFSMPQGGMAALETQPPLDIKAYQYDIVCNGLELSSGCYPQPPTRHHVQGV